jgi:2-dehydropantoate 2-reductase
MRADLEAVRAQGLRTRTPDGDLLVKPAQVHASTASIGPCDLVIVALKCTANSALAALVPPLLKAETAILTLQNGLGNEEFLGGHFGTDRILGGLCFICLNRIAPGVVENFFPGYLVIGEAGGPPRDRTRSLVELWKRAGIDCRLATSLQEARWRKLCWNIPFNGLAIAAGGRDTQQVLAESSLVELIWELMREVQATARALGHEIEDEFLQRQLDITYPMGPYKPSSLVDFQLGREVEVEAIWGEPLRVARRVGVRTPHLETLYWLLLALCAGARRA